MIYTLNDIQNYFIQKLIDIYSPIEIRQLVNIIFEEKYNIKQNELIGNKIKINQEQWDELKNIVGRLKNYEPVQYVSGRAFFYDIVLKVNPVVFIPRSETEELTTWIIDNTRGINREKLKILDIGTGSGCIAITLAKHIKKAIVEAVDYSDLIINLARENALLNNISGISFYKFDILKNRTSRMNKSYDIIVSNPPYVQTKELNNVDKSVKRYEPTEAYLVPDDKPLIFYEAIADFAKINLCIKGMLFLELNEFLYKDIYNLIKKRGYKNIEIREDIRGKKRMLKAIKPG